jgi:hypothetical protein
MFLCAKKLQEGIKLKAFFILLRDMNVWMQLPNSVKLCTVTSLERLYTTRRQHRKLYAGKIKQKYNRLLLLPQLFFYRNYISTGISHCCNVIG